MNRILKICLALVLVLGLSSINKSQAQYYYYGDYYIPNTIIKFSPLSVFDAYPAIQFSLEYKLKGKENISIQHELGYITRLFTEDQYNLFNDRYLNIQGFRFRNEIRFFMKDLIVPGNGSYVAPELFFLMADHQRDRVFNMPGGIATQDVYDVHKRVIGYHLKMGYQQIKNDRFILDVYAGVGARHVYIDSFGKPWNYDSQETERGDIADGKYIRPSLSLGFKIGYILNTGKTQGDDNPVPVFK